MAMFQKKSESKGIPVQQVSQMRQQGYENSQIITALQKDGFSSADIFDAMNQADIHGEMEPAQQTAPALEETPMFQPQQYNYEPQQYAPAPQPQYAAPSSNPNTEELVEAIIEEKWSDLAKNISKIIEWKNRMDTKMQLMDQDIKALKEQYTRMHDAVLGKLADYDKSILNVGADLRAMEKAFTDVLPEFSQSVTQLTEIAKAMKKK
ncbi:MAG: hypothetical protein ABIA93_01730 [Candidatus Woesearchaeota archaeon]